MGIFVDEMKYLNSIFIFSINFGGSKHSKVPLWNSEMEWIYLKANLWDCGTKVEVLYVVSSLYSSSLKEGKEDFT